MPQPPALGELSYEMTGAPASDTNALGLAVITAGEQSKNIIVSPVSLTLALAMLGAGVTGEGDAELASILGLSGSARTEAYAALAAALGGYQDGEFSLDEIPEEPFLRIANNLVVNEGFEVKDGFTDALTSGFDATVNTTDLGSAEGKEVLDAWVRERTEGLIEQSAIQPDPELQLVLQNALLFAARWQQLFLPDLTTTEDFTRAGGDAVGAQMMNGEFTVAYGEKDGYTAIALPYASDFTAFFVLPPEGDAPTPDGVQAAIAAIGEQVRATVQIPGFDLKVTTDVKSFLEAQGVTALFTDPASLSGIAEGAPVVSAITQQARLIVNESGTVGAALTEIAMTTSLPPEPTHEFRADRPFTMIVQHNDTGVHLFSAYIADPTAE